MRKCCVVGVLALLLTGCASQETLETVNDVQLQPVSAVMQQVMVELPEEVATPVLQSEEGGKLYMGDGYTLTLQTLEGGDLAKTLRSVTGFPKEELQLMETVRGEAKRYDCVWTAAGETENQICRASVLDDGSYHYVLTAMAPESRAGQLQQTFREVFNSFRLVSAQMALDTGS